MARRIDVELTSARDDGTWTWRAAGAKQPKGVVEGDLLYPGAKVGDVVRAEAEFEIDGIVITAVLPPKEKRSDPERIEILGPRRPPAPVTSAGRADRGPGRERSRPDDGKPPRRRPPREAGERRPAAARRPADAAPAPTRPKPKRLQPGHAHRTAVLESLRPEQRPVAEQVLRGGLPAVRQAVDAQNAGRPEGQPPIAAEPLVAMAEELLPRLKTAEWLDRAEAAVAQVDEIPLRDLRSVVTSADTATRDDSARMLAGTLRDALDRRVTAAREQWVAEIDQALSEGRLVRALRISARPPDPGTRFPAELASRMADAASEAMAPDVAADRWAVLLEAVAASPVRRSVKPVGLPEEPGDELLAAAKAAAGRIPALGAMLGITMPPPPRPPRGRPPGGERKPSQPTAPAQG